MKVLSVQSSANTAGSYTRLVSKEFLRELAKKHPDVELIERDTAHQPLPYISPEVLGALFTPADKHSAKDKALLLASNQATDELLQADLVVIGAPMYNFGIPAALKAWVDGVVRVGKTFRYTEQGPVGLIPPGKKVVLVTATGGLYSEQPMRGLDFVEPYMRGILGFMGLTEIHSIRLEGIAYGPEAAAAASKKAVAAAHALAAEL